MLIYLYIFPLELKDLCAKINAEQRPHVLPSSPGDLNISLPVSRLFNRTCKVLTVVF